MNSNPTNVDNDLQKAIDDITNTTSTDPVFSDPVAAPSTVPEGDTGELGEPVGPFPEPPKLNVVPPAPEPIAPLEAMSGVPELTMPAPEPAPAPAPAPAPESTPAPAPVSTPTAEVAPTSNAQEIKKAALHDLVPLLEKISMDPTQKFEIYRDIFNELKDYTVLEPAYRVARDIADENKRAEALIYLIEAINKM